MIIKILTLKYEPIFHRKIFHGMRLFPLLFILIRGSTSLCWGSIIYIIFLKMKISYKCQHFKIICSFYLQELCLHTKLLAPVNCAIADFLMKAPEPPPALIVRNAVQMLKVGIFIDLFYLAILLEI